MQVTPSGPTRTSTRLSRAGDGGVGDLLADRRFLVDSVAPPLLFVSANAAAGLRWAAGLSLGLALGVLVWRVLVGQRVLYAATGLAGAVVSVGIALLSGRAATYFLPGIIGNAVFGIACVVSVLLRRPLIALSSRVLYRWPLTWYLDDRVRPAYSEITWVWAIFYLAKAAVQAWLVGRDATEVLAAVRIATGLPAFALLLVVTYAYVNRRLARLGAPSVAEHVELSGQAEHSGQHAEHIGHIGHIGRAGHVGHVGRAGHAEHAGDAAAATPEQRATPSSRRGATDR